MTSESLPVTEDKEKLPMVEFHYAPDRRDIDGVSQKHFYELGGRLNIGREALGNLAQAISMPTFGQVDEEGDQSPRSTSPFVERKSEDKYGTVAGGQAPFAMSVDRNRKARLSEFPSLPAVVQTFKSPFDVGEQKNAGPSKILVTSQTVVEE